MRFSMIIPAFNAEDHIIKGLESIKAQTFKDYELIVVCDRCKDRTKEIAESYGAKTLEVDFGRDGLTRNAGLDIAQGEYILFMDDDDWLLHEFVFEQINKKLKETNDPELLCFSFIWKGVMYANPIARNGNLYPSVWNKAWKRSWIGDTRFTDVYSISDFYFHNAMMKKPHRRIIWDSPCVYYNYLRPGSISDEMGRSVEGTKRAWRID
ncbi:MAG: glycosyltransferase family 2 protein [Lachnospiraceae bacterium]|nr:glycosyltransferase family 2 protein [Lachnospiraceae bacterium]